MGGSVSLPSLSMTKAMGMVVGNAAYEWGSTRVMKVSPRNPEVDKLTDSTTISIAVILKIVSSILSAIIIMKRSSVFLTWIVMKEMSRGFLFFIMTMREWDD